MAALTAPVIRASKEDGDLMTFPVAASTNIYRGSIVFANASGYAVPAADTASFNSLGIAIADALNGSGGAAAISVTVKRYGIVALPYTGVAIAAIGTKCYGVSDNEVAAAATTTNDVAVGRVVGVAATNVAWVDIGDKV